MTITEKREQDALVIGLEGSLDTLTAPELEAFLDTAFGGRAGGNGLYSGGRAPGGSARPGKRRGGW